MGEKPIDWEQRARTMRAARRLVLALDDMARDCSGEEFKEINEKFGLKIDEERIDKSFRSLYKQLQELLASLPLVLNDTTPAPAVPEFRGSFDFSVLGTLPEFGKQAPPFEGHCQSSILPADGAPVRRCNLSFGHKGMHSTPLPNGEIYNWAP